MSQKATGQKPASAAKGTYASKHLLSPMLFPDLGHPRQDSLREWKTFLLSSFGGLRLFPWGCSLRPPLYCLDHNSIPIGNLRRKMASDEIPRGMEYLLLVIPRRLETVSMGLQSEAAALLP